MKFKWLALMVAGVCAASSQMALATSIPVTTTFGAYPSATFGGSGIYNDATMINTGTFDANTMNPNTITIVMAATPRGVGPELANNGVNTFFANPGTSAPGKGTWNMDYDVNSSAGSLVGYTLTLLYGKEGGPTFSLNLVTSFPDSKGLPGSWQNSENLGFGQFGSLGYDPTASGVYDFTIQAQKGDFIAQSATMHVSVGAVPDGGNTLLLGCFGLGGLFFVNKHVKKLKRAGSMTLTA